MTDEQPTIAAASHPTEVAALSDELTGQLLSGRYRVEECLGEGAMGAVYRAEHTLMKKTVAIKVLQAQVGGRDDLVERFQREAQAAANIDHPNICSASDFGRMDDGTFFLVIEYLEGRTLEDEIDQNGPLSPDRSKHILAQIASGLARAHELDVVHRDLKPENIMLVERDADPDFVKILDFGVARVRLTDEHEQAQLTKAGSVWGTPCYMSPEQAAGGEVDGRSDLYSLGVILYEMLAGHPPFEDSNPARVMAMHLTEQPEPLESPAIPAELSQLLSRLLDKSPDKRPTSAQALCDELLNGPPAPSDSTPGDALSVQPARQLTEQIVDTVGRVAVAARPTYERAVRWFRAQTMIVQGASAGIAAAMILAVAAVPILVIASLSGGPETNEERKAVERNLTAERRAFLKKAGLEAVPDLLESNQTTAALDALGAVDKAYDDNPHVNYLRGRVNGARGRWSASVENYTQAVSEESLYAHDAVLIEHVFERFSDRSDHRAEEAQALIEDHLDSPFVSNRLAELATFGDHSKTRKRARDVLDKTGRMRDLDDWRRHGVALRHGDNCEQRRRAIEAIADAGDPQALPVLEYYADKNKLGCGVLNLEDCYGCIRGDLKKAIKALKAL
jgi:serine/threonine-protein kinase